MGRRELPGPEPMGIGPGRADGSVVLDFRDGRLLEVDLPSLEAGRRARFGGDGWPVAWGKHVLWPPDGPIFVASMTGVVAVVDAVSLELTEAIPIGNAVSALAPDPPAGQLYATGYVGGELLRIDLAERRVAARAPTTRTPKGLLVLPERGLVLVSGFASGELVVHRAGDLAELARLPLGRLLRPLRLDASTGRVYTASSCGVLELDPNALLHDVTGPAGPES